MRWTFRTVTFSADRSHADDHGLVILSWLRVMVAWRQPIAVGRIDVMFGPMDDDAQGGQMSVADMVARHGSDPRRPSEVVVLRPSADALATLLTGGPVVRTWDEHLSDEHLIDEHLGQEHATRTVVEAIAPGHEQEQIADLAAALGDTDVALLLFRRPPERLPVGVVTESLCGHGLNVLDGCATTDRFGRTVLAVSRDADRQVRAHPCGIPLADDEPGRLRQRNEGFIEGLALRSDVQLLRRRLEGQAAELSHVRRECGHLDQELSAAQDALRASSRSQAADERLLGAGEGSSAPAGRGQATPASEIRGIRWTRRAGRLVARGANAGSRRLARAIARLRRR
jgi:hypothetical protein